MRELGRMAMWGTGIFAILGLASLVLAVITRREPAPAPATTVHARPTDAGVRRVDAGVDAGRDAATDAHVVYALDDFVRRPEHVAEGCPDVPLVDHVGPWQPALRVHPSFEEAVVLLESATRETAREIYGRDVRTMFSASSYRCTTVRRRPERISEHALGNAIDLRGIVLDDGTETTVGAHWHAATEADAIHARFWRTLVERVHARGIFRGILGPPAPDHLEHLHFDRGPSTFIELVLDPG